MLNLNLDDIQNIKKDELTPEQLANLEKYSVGSEIIAYKDMLSDVVMNLSSNAEKIQGVPTVNWPYFNHLIGGAREGELAIITSDTGMGKTTFAINWAVDMMEAGHKVLYLSLENSPENVAESVTRMLIGRKLNIPINQKDKDDIKNISEVFKDSMYFLNSDSIPVYEKLANAIKYCKVMFDIRMVVVDHLDVIQPVRLGSESYVDQQKNMVYSLHKLAQRLGITVLAIQHPAKLGTKGTTETYDRGDRWISLDELKGSAAFKQIPDIVLTMRQPSTEENLVEIKFEKIRATQYSSSRQKVVQFIYRHDCLRMVEREYQDG